SGITDRAGSAHEENRMRVDAERRVVDTLVVILRPVEYDGAAFESLRIGRIAQIALAEFRRDHAGLHDRRGEQVTAQDPETGPLLDRLLERPDDLLVLDDRPAAVL